MSTHWHQTKLHSGLEVLELLLAEIYQCLQLLDKLLEEEIQLGRGPRLDAEERQHRCDVGVPASCSGGLPLQATFAHPRGATDPCARAPPENEEPQMLW